ncbi:MAG TPA: acyl-CoA dehydrogenase family protein [Polyangia bacterium]|nr:acyl-CoA dehydrogenase family protein [Polyangia bacterium]
MLDFTDEQKMARQMLRQWADKELAPHVAKMEKGEILPYDIMRKLIRAFGMDEMIRAQLGKLEDAPDKPEGAAKKERGAMGDPGLMAVVSMELSRVCPGFCLAFGASLGLAGGAIMAKGTNAQKLKWARPILTMEKIGAWGMTEPGAGSDAFGSMRTTARRDGDQFVLNGQKTFITNAPFADTFVIYAKLEGNEDSRYRPFHAFIVERGTPGLSTGKPMDKMGMHSSPTGEVFLEDVRVPVEQLLGGRLEEHSREEARDVFHGERTGMAPMCLGIIERCLEDALAYSKQRETWGKKIAEYQLVQEKLARMYVARENVRNMLFRQFEKIHKKVPISMAEASACKLYCARVTTEVALEAIQIMGGNGYMREYHVEMLMRDAKLLQIGGGADEIQIITIARHLLKDGIPA